MKITLKQPIQIEVKGKAIEFPYAHLSLSMSTGFTNPDSYSVSLRLVPFRITDEGQIEKLEDRAFTLSSLDGLDKTIHGGSEQLSTLTTEIISSIQKFVNG